MKTKFLAIRLSATEKKRLEKAAGEFGCSKSEFVRHLLATFTLRQEIAGGYPDEKNPTYQEDRSLEDPAIWEQVFWGPITGKSSRKIIKPELSHGVDNRTPEGSQLWLKGA